MISRHNNSMFAFFRLKSRLVDMGQSILNYTRTFQLENNLSVLQARDRDITRQVAESHFIQYASISTFLCYTCIAKLLLKDTYVHTLGKRQSKEKCRGHDLDVIYFDGFRLCESNSADMKLLVMAVNSFLRNYSTSSSLLNYSMNSATNPIADLVSRAARPHELGERGGWRRTRLFRCVPRHHARRYRHLYFPKPSLSSRSLLMSSAYSNLMQVTDICCGTRIIKPVSTRQTRT